MRHEPIKLNYVQGSPEWHRWRLNTITASKIPAIMGESPFKTRFQVWEEMMGLGGEQEQTSAMKRGVELEPHVRAVVSTRLEVDLKPCCFQHPRISYFGASLDGISADGKTAIEIKCGNRVDHELTKFGIVPDKYLGQLNAIMEVMGLDTMYYASNYGAVIEDGVLKDPGETEIIPVIRNLSYVASMIDKVHEFWKFVKDFVPPPLDNKDFVENNSEDWKKKAERYKELEQAIKNLEKEKDSLRNDLLFMTQGHSTIGGGIRVCKIVEKGRIDYSQIPDLIGLNLDAYRKEPITKWRIS